MNSGFREAHRVTSVACQRRPQSLSKAIEECVLDNHKIKGADYEARTSISGNVIASDGINTTTQGVVIGLQNKLEGEKHEP